MNITPSLLPEQSRQRQKEAERIRFMNKREIARQRALRSGEGRMLAEATKSLREEMRK